MSLIVLIDKIMQEMNNGNIVLGLFLDFIKAFETVNHDILINNLSLYDIRGKALEWIKIIYLTGNNMSYTRNINHLCLILNVEYHRSLY